MIPKLRFKNSFRTNKVNNTKKEALNIQCSRKKLKASSIITYSTILSKEGDSLYTLTPFLSSQHAKISKSSASRGTIEHTLKATPTTEVMNTQAPTLLLILDGWGIRADPFGNAIAHAHTPHWDALWTQCPHQLIQGCGEAVGLPEQQMGNSEVGHLNLGAGRIVHQDYTRINAQIDQGEFFKNPVLLDTMEQLKHSGRALHLMGLVSDGGVHSHERHLYALLEMAQHVGVRTVYIHAFLDGRDTLPQSAHASLTRLEEKCRALKLGQIVSLIGRYYAMDRDQRWDRVIKAYDLVTQGLGQFSAPDPLSGLQEAYDRHETDEFVQATRIGPAHTPPIRIEDGDALMYFNFRSDRARALSHAFIHPQFEGFTRQAHPQLSAFVCMTQYDDALKTPIAFSPQVIHNSLGEVLQNEGLTQLRLAETEKYAHVTFFFNGGIESPFTGETRILVPSAQVATYDQCPQMSLKAVEKELVQAILSQSYDCIICNFANADMVGHTGNFEAAVQAIEAIDKTLGHVIQALKDTQGQALITADHGNAECMYSNAQKDPHTSHTLSKVPLIYFGPNAYRFSNTPGKLSDVAVTLLNIMDIPVPKEMTGHNLLLKDEQ